MCFSVSISSASLGCYGGDEVMTIDDNGGGHVGFQCVEKLGKGCLSEADMATLVTMLTKLLQNHFDRQAQRQGECLGKTVGGGG